MALCLALVACDNQDVVNSSVDTTFKGLFNIDSISPVSASPGSEVTIKGEGFNAKTAVTFANVNAEIKSQSESEIIFIVPEGKPSVTSLTVTSGEESYSSGFVRNSKDGTPIIAGQEQKDICDNQRYFDGNGEERVGLKDCREKYSKCTASGQIGCIATPEYVASDLNLKDGQTKVCSSDGEIECIAVENFKAADITGILPSDIFIDHKIAGISGTKPLPLAACNSDGETNCTSTNEFRAGDVLGKEANILGDHTVGGLAGTYSPDLPDPKNVLSPNPVGLTIGSLTLPGVESVLAGSKYGPDDDFTGVFVLPAATNVLKGTAAYGVAGALLTPSFEPDLPDVGNVLNTDTVKSVQGTLTLPNEKYVLSGISYGVGGTPSTGTLTLPDEINVKTGTPAYGVSGTSKTPSYTPDFPPKDHVAATAIVNGEAGTLTIPLEKYVLKDIKYGANDAKSGTLTLPIPSAVHSIAEKYGVADDLKTPAYTPDFPDVGNVYNDTVDNVPGTATIPNAGQVIGGVTFGLPGPARLTGTLSTPVPSDVLIGEPAYGMSSVFIPSYDPDFPSRTSVLESQKVNGVFGTVSIPDQIYVESGASQYGIEGNLATGTLRIPLASEVRSTAAKYGIDGALITPNYQPDFPDPQNVLNVATTNGSPGLIPTCSNNAQNGCYTTVSFKAGNQTNLVATNLRTNVTVAGVTGNYPSATNPFVRDLFKFELKSFGPTSDLGQVEFWDSAGIKYTGNVGEQTNIGVLPNDTSYANANFLFKQIIVEGDPDLVPTNIRSGVNIFGVSGTFSGTGATNCSSDGALSCVTISTFPAVNKSVNAKAENIRVGYKIGGVDGAFMTTNDKYLQIIAPKQWKDKTVSNSFVLKFKANDPDMTNAVISVYRSTNNSGCNSFLTGWTPVSTSTTLRQVDISTTLNTTGWPAGYHYICLKFDASSTFYTMSESPIAHGIEGSCKNADGANWQNRDGGCALVTGATPIIFSKESSTTMPSGLSDSYCNSLNESGVSDWIRPTHHQIVAAGHARASNQFDLPAVYYHTSSGRTATFSPPTYRTYSQTDYAICVRP